MNENHRKYAEEAYQIVRYASLKIGARLPGSENERKFHNFMAERLKEIGVKPHKEEFSVAPRGAIGGLGYAGWVGIFLSAAIYLAIQFQFLWIPMAIVSVLLWVWLCAGPFFYSRIFDGFFKQEISQNTWGEVTAPGGKYDYTIILSGHTDTSWCWRHSAYAKKFKDTKPEMGLILTFLKVGFGVICVLFLTIVSIAKAIIFSGYFFGADWAAARMQTKSYGVFTYMLLFIPVITAIGSAFIARWGDPDPKNASRGAMDNATGIALSYEILKYFKENPEKIPKGARIIDLNIGSEEPGLRGAMAFADEHRNDGMLKNCWNLNIDSIADKEYMEVVNGDAAQFTRFDKDLEKMFVETFKEQGIVSKSKNYTIKNPVGGCDSTPMVRAGVKSVTFAAQNPTLTYYYHTFYDMPDRFDADVVGTGFDVALGVIEKIGEYQQAHGFTGLNN